MWLILIKKEIKNGQFKSKRDQKSIQNVIDDTILTLESELSCNRRPNLLESNLELLMIRF